MSTQDFQQGNNPQKDNRKLIYGILIVALLGTWGYIFYDKSQHKETVTFLETKISNIDSARIALQAEFTSVTAKADSLTKDNLQLQGELAEKNAGIQKMRSDIASILKKKNATTAELAQAKQMIGELNGKIDGLIAEVEKLKAENQQLTTANTQLNTEKTQLTTEKKGLEENLNTTKNEKRPE